MVDDRTSGEGLAQLPPVQGLTGPHDAFVVAGNLAFFSGVLPLHDGAVAQRGVVGQGVSLEDAKRCGTLCALQLLARVVERFGGLDVVVSVPKLTVFVASDASFTAQSEVANAVSAVLTSWLGPAVRHTRSAIGVAALPKGAPVEIEGVVALATNAILE